MKASFSAIGFASLLTASLVLGGGCDEEDDDGSDGADGVDDNGSEDTGTDDGVDDGSEGADDAGDGCADEGGVEDSGGEECEAYNECVLSSCGAQYDACFGDDWENGNFGGSCEAYFDCVFECDCDATCVQGCELSAECQNCQVEIATCASTNCSEELMECGEASPLPGPTDMWSPAPVSQSG